MMETEIAAAFLRYFLTETHMTAPATTPETPSSTPTAADETDQTETVTATGPDTITTEPAAVQVKIDRLHEILTAIGSRLVAFDHILVTEARALLSDLGLTASEK